MRRRIFDYFAESGEEILYLLGRAQFRFGLFLARVREWMMKTYDG